MSFKTQPIHPRSANRAPQPFGSCATHPRLQVERVTFTGQVHHQDKHPTRIQFLSGGSVTFSHRFISSTQSGVAQHSLATLHSSGSRVRNPRRAIDRYHGGRAGKNDVAGVADVELDEKFNPSTQEEPRGYDDAMTRVNGRGLSKNGGRTCCKVVNFTAM
jgi:hypothetical protein